MNFSYAGEPLAFVGRVEMPVTFFVGLDNISNQSEPSLFADLTPLNPKPSLISSLSNKEFNCKFVKNDSDGTKIYTCKTQFTIIINKPDINLTFKTVLNDSTSFFENKTFHFNLDNSNPEITAIRSDFKFGDYYIIASRKPSKIYFDIQDSTGTFKNRNLFFKIGSNPNSRVVNCTDSVCSGFFIGSCSDSFQKIFVTGQSGDDAGNAFTGVTKSNFKCDIESPSLHGSNPISISFDNSLYPNPKSGDNIELSVLVDEDVSGVNAMANLSGLIENDNLIPGNCVLSEQGFYNCSWQVPNILSGDHEVKFIINDGVGRTLLNSSSGETVDSLVFPIHVDFFQTANNGTTPNFFQPVIGSISAPKGYNRIAVDLALKNHYDFPLYATYNLRRSSTGGSIEILRSFIDPSKCYLTNNDVQVNALNYFSDIKIKNPLLNYDETNRISFVLSPNTDINDLSDSFDIVCNLSLIVRENKKKVYENPTTTLFKTTIKFKNSALGNTEPGEKLVEQIKLQEKRLNSTWKFIGVLNTIAGTLSGICNVDKTLSNTFTTAVGGQLTSFAVGSVSSSAGGMLNTLFTGMLGKVKILGDPVMEGNSSKSQLRQLMTKACEWSTCSLEKQGKNNRDNWYFSGSTHLSSVAEKPDGEDWEGVGVDIGKDLFSNVDIPNPKESLISSVYSHCWPGVVYNLNKYREIECNALLCMKQQSKVGMDLSVCSKTKAQAICKNVVGEAFDLPYVREAKNIMNNANSFVQLIIPNTLKYVTSNFFCREVLNEDEVLHKTDSLGKKAKVVACNLPESIGVQLNMKVKTTSSGTNFQYPVSNDVCAMAMCNKENPQDCVKTNSIVDNWIGKTLKAIGLDSLPGANVPYQSPIKSYSINDYQSVLDKYNKAKSKNNKEDMKQYVQELIRMGAITDENDIGKFKNSLNLNLKLAGNNSNALLTPSSSGTGLILTTMDPVDYAKRIEELKKKEKDAGITDEDKQKIKQYDELKDYLTNILNHDLENEKARLDSLKKQLDELPTCSETDILKQIQQIDINIKKSNGEKTTLTNQLSDADFYLTTWKNHYNDLTLKLSELNDEYKKESDPDLKRTISHTMFLVSKEFDYTSKNISFFSNKKQQILNSLTILDTNLTNLKDKKIKLNNDVSISNKNYLNISNEIWRTNITINTINSTIQKKEKLLNDFKNITELKKKQKEEAKILGEVDLDRANILKEVNNEQKNILNQIGNLTGCQSRTCSRQRKLLKLKLTELNKLNETFSGPNYNNASVVKDINKKFVEDYEAQQESFRMYSQLENLADSTASILMSTGILNYGVLSNYGANTTVGKISDLANTYLNSENLITGICSPFTRGLSGNHGVEDLGAVQCVGTKCSPVLTFGAERVTYTFTSEDNHTYLYTLVYALGPVYRGTSNVDDSSIKYNIYLVPAEGGSAKKLFNVTWRELPLGAPLVDSLSFVGKNKYSKICIRFATNYPPQTWGSKKEFCRSIVDSDQGRSSFDTGSPLTRDYSAPSNGGSYTDSGSNDEQDPNAISGDI